MDQNAWLAGIVGVAAVVLVALVLVALRAVTGARRSRLGSPAADPPPSSVAYAARGLGYLFGGINTPRRRRSVEGNLGRAFTRIDAVDPYAGARRIGLALADVGLLTPVPRPDEDATRERTWPAASTFEWQRREDHE